MKRTVALPVLLIAVLALVAIAVWASGLTSTGETPSVSPSTSVGPPSQSPLVTDSTESPSRPPDVSAAPEGTPGQSITPPPIPTPELRPDITLGPQDMDKAATSLAGEARCSEEFIGVAEADLQWRPATPVGEEQLVEISIFAFEPGKSVFSDSLGPTEDRVVLNAVSGQAIHEWRVLTRHGNTWTPSDPAEFEGVTCTFQ
jgi:hypothetical protein